MAAAEFSLPDGFLFGVATAGFQIEGGFNGSGEPANNWRTWEVDGRVEPSGIALDFWNRYEEHLDRVAALGCNAFRLSVEWARCVPADGEVDDDAFIRYQRILDACHDRRLEPLVTLHHFTHPAWLGEDLWRRLEAPARFAEWAELAAARLADRCRLWVTTNEPNVLAVQTWMTGAFPPGRRLDVAGTVRTLDHLLAAHVLAYGAIRRHRHDAVIATNTYALDVYELDRMLIDVLLARTHGVSRHDVHAWLHERKHWFEVAFPAMGPRAAAVRRVAETAIPLAKAMPRAVTAAYDSAHASTLDVVQIDWYDAVTARHLRLPGHRTAGGRNWMPERMLWDDPPEPHGLVRYAAAGAEPDLATWVVENGLCNRVRRGRSFPRLDGWDRPRYLRAHLGAVVDSIRRGVDVGAYFHWTLADNYEWGSYEPRFGIYGVDRERGTRWLDTDSMGRASAAEFRRLIEGLRAGDVSVLERQEDAWPTSYSLGRPGA